MKNTEAYDLVSNLKVALLKDAIADNTNGRLARAVRTFLGAQA